MLPRLNTTCYFNSSLRTVYENETRDCTSTQCERDKQVLRACPIVMSYSWLQQGRSELSMELYQHLKGHRLAIVGDSMARQVFSVLVGLLRDETSFLDFHTWNPARYQLWRRPPTLHDHLDIFYRPLRCVNAAHNCTNYRTIDWDALPIEHDTDAPAPDVDISWIPMPLWSSARDALRVASAAERAASRPFDLMLVFVPSAWHLDEADPGLPPGVFDRAPSSFWDAWVAWQHQSTAHRNARYAALTMPLEHVVACSGTQQHTNEMFIMKYRLHPSTVRRQCDERGCCLGSATAARNTLRGLPAGWSRVDFAALTKARPPMALVGGNWHYECILHRAGVNNCAHRPLIRMGVLDECNQKMQTWLSLTADVGWTPRRNGDCGEEGNTMLWKHLLRSAWLLGPRSVRPRATGTASARPSASQPGNAAFTNAMRS